MGSDTCTANSAQKNAAGRSRVVGPGAGRSVEIVADRAQHLAGTGDQLLIGGGRRERVSRDLLQQPNGIASAQLQRCGSIAANTSSPPGVHAQR
jgi:hypothetical protein